MLGFQTRNSPTITRALAHSLVITIELNFVAMGRLILENKPHKDTCQRWCQLKDSNKQVVNLCWQRRIVVKHQKSLMVAAFRDDADVVPTPFSAVGSLMSHPVQRPIGL